MTMKGIFHPRNPQKYFGKVNQICFRSSWEHRLMMFLDSSASVLQWNSEGIGIPYIKPTDGRVHTYYPDFFVISQDREGNIRKEIIEIKPMKETVLTENSSPHDKMAWVINQAKWQAARAFASSKNATFRVMTEVEIFGAKAPTKKRRTPRKKK